jgi:hypothetical protein
MVSRALIAFTAVLALGCTSVNSSAFAASHGGGHGGTVAMDAMTTTAVSASSRII